MNGNKTVCEGGRGREGRGNDTNTTIVWDKKVCVREGGGERKGK